MKHNVPPLRSSEIPGVILAGGLSTRMGVDKAHVRLGGVSLIVRAVQRLGLQVSSVAISANGPLAVECTLGAPVFADLGGERSGPLGGILSALAHVREHHPLATHVATVPTDSPFFPIDLVARLGAAIDHPERIAVASSSGGLHSVFGLWPVALADDLADWLRDGQSLRLRTWLDRHGASQVHFPDRETPRGPFDPFFNINTPEELALAESWLGTLEP
ncbi:molybdenum cofactor guanylyltransferase [Rhizobium sp. ARZ01]|uniref:molybdenum cofactor guanylyltransferase MobA n=1 Tax=Rhizobium sp. ARZ01 TaxID=2769313 RepID=UPI001780A4D3|nr:molybdenum cofactor guanylyltransferase MobA [Rhizobium sp. ARZ01]MBD9372216.1 molybdenum cofactor guanylyltransferase [Rhizobium sp. ARZ01]